METTAYYLIRRTFGGVFCTPLVKSRRLLVGIRLGKIVSTDIRK